MKTVDMDNIESLIEELALDDCIVSLVVEMTEREDHDELYCAFISDDDKYNIILDRNGDKYLRAFGASFKEALKNLNELCA